MAVAVLMISTIAGAHAKAGTLEDAIAIKPPTGVVLGRQLAMRITLRKDSFDVCTALENTGSEDVYVTANVSRQISIWRYDEDGIPVIHEQDGFIPHSMWIPPYSWEERSYFEVEPHARYEVCKSYRYDKDFPTNTVRIQSRFLSWLRHDAKVPDVMKNIWQKFSVRPLYDDEVLYSNICTLDRAAKLVTCAPQEQTADH
ncbi:MAG: hypothetical protein GC166_05825 [Alphaproteobacteria bacterium]|nr:hypothetical protein [Alphaproteobacteria bacterium]